MIYSHSAITILRKAYWLFFIFTIIIIALFLPLGIKSEKGVATIEQSVELASIDESIKEINKFAFNIEDIVVVVKSLDNNGIISNQTSLLISNITYSLRKNQTIYSHLRNNKLITTLFTEGRNLVKEYYSALQKVTILGNLTIFTIYNGTNYFINKTTTYFSQTGNMTYSILKAKNQTKYYLEKTLYVLSGGYFFIKHSEEIFQRISDYYEKLSLEDPLVLTNKSYALKIMDDFIFRNLPQNLTLLISQELSSFFKQIVTSESLLINYWNETLIYVIVAKWAFNDADSTYVSLVKQSFAGGNMLQPIIIADTDYISILKLEKTVIGLKKEIIIQLLETFTNYEPVKRPKPDITVFVIPINSSNLTLKQYITLYDMIKQLINQQNKNLPEYNISIFSSRMLEVEVGNQYTHEFIRIDLWIGIVVIIVLLILFRKIFSSFLGLSLLIISNMTARGFLLFLNQSIGLMIYKEGYVIGNSLLMGASINYIVFIFSLYHEKSFLRGHDSIKKIISDNTRIKRIINSYTTVIITSSVMFTALSPLILSVSLKSFKTIGIVVLTELPLIILIIFSLFPLISKIIDTENAIHSYKRIKNRLPKIKISVLIPHEKTVKYMLKNAKKIVAFTIVLWVILGITVYSAGFSQNPLDMMSNEGENQQILNEIINYFPDEFFSKLMIVVQFDKPISLIINNYSEPTVKDLFDLVLFLSSFNHQAIYSPITPYGNIEQNNNLQGNLTILITNNIIQTFLSSDKTKVLIIFVIHGSSFSTETGILVSKIEQQTSQKIQSLTHIKHVYFGGTPYQTSKYTNNIFQDLIIILPLSIILSFILLSLWTKSFFLPIRFQYTVITGFIISLFFSQFISILIFKTPLNFLVILSSFGLLNALGLDFDIFFYVHYLKEKGTKTRRIVSALESSFNSILSAGIVMILSFSVLIFSPIMMLKQLGLTITVSILIDIFFIRFFLSPVIIGFISKEKAKLLQ